MCDTEKHGQHVKKYTVYILSQYNMHWMLLSLTYIHSYIVLMAMTKEQCRYSYVTEEENKMLQVVQQAEVYSVG